MALPQLPEPGGRWWPPRFLGYRDKMLLVLGVGWVFMGLAVPDERQFPGVLHFVLPQWLRMALWVVSGLIAIAVAFRPLRRPNDAYAWLALFIGPAVRGLSYMWAWIDWLVPAGSEGYSRGWAWALIYAIMLGVIIVAASWPESPANSRTLQHAAQEAEQP